MTLQDSTHETPLSPPRHDHAVACATCPGLTRRGVLRSAGVVSLGAAAAALLAACSSDSGGSTTEGSSGSSDASTDGSTGSSGSGGSTELAALADIPVGGLLGVELPDGTPVILSQPVAGTVVAMSAVCTHQGCTVQVDGEELVCPCHDSVFAADGTVVSGPADSPLPSVAVRVEGDAVVTA